jgi:hypothetical protein
MSTIFKNAVVLSAILFSLTVRGAFTVSNFNIASSHTSTNGTLSISGTFSSVSNPLSTSGGWVVSGFDVDLLGGNALLPVLPTVTIFPTNEAVVLKQTLWICAQASGSPPLGYQWYKSGIALIHQTNNALLLPAGTTNNAGNYCVLVTSPFGSVTSQVTTVTIARKATLKLTVTSPKAKQKVLTPTLKLAGSTKDKLPVTQVYYSLNDSVWAQAATANQWTNWTADASLQTGSNTVRVAALDAGGNLTVSKPISFTYIVYAPLTVRTNGAGKIAPADNGKLLQIGSSYTLKATPSAGSSFVNWTDNSGGILGSATSLTFQMRSNLTITANFRSNAAPQNGVRSLVTGVQGDSNAPVLSILQTGKTIQISWPSTLTGWALEQSPDFGLSHWTPSVGVTDNGTNKTLTLIAPPGSLFFRLTHQ